MVTDPQVTVTFGTIVICYTIYEKCRREQVHKEVGDARFIANSEGHMILKPRKTNTEATRFLIRRGSRQVVSFSAGNQCLN